MPELLSANELAARLKTPVNWLYVQIREGRTQIDPQRNGMYLFSNNLEFFERLENSEAITLRASISESVSLIRGCIHIGDRSLPGLLLGTQHVSPTIPVGLNQNLSHTAL